MRYAVFVYSIPLGEPGDTNPDVGVIGGEGEMERAAESLAEMIAQEGVQREPALFDDFSVRVLESALTTWAIRDTNDTHKEDN